MFEKILIANRGEIACRIIKTAKKLGVQTVIVYSEADKNSLAVQWADEAYCIGEAPSAKSYLDGEKILAVAKKTGTQAIHPGYGFLSENAAFARACEAANIVFIGPPASAIEAMGSKSAAKTLAEASHVPVTPGYHGAEQSLDKLQKEARNIGFPVLIKATAGGGGKGMRAVFNPENFADELAGAQREAKASFGDDRVLLEKYLIEPRHVEIQIFCDHHGNAVYLFERDCSIQRRHQKVVEEAPAPHLKPEIRKAMGEAAVQAALGIGYVGAGTIEFLLDKDDHFYFMEMNTRLQVEHPVTEMISRQDLVEWQLRVACGEPLPLKQDDLHIHGHAIEVRIYAEDPDNQFLPSIGPLLYWEPPVETAFVRVDTGFRQNDAISTYYDPMMAKLIVWGETRIIAIRRLLQALKHYYVIGVKNNIAFLQRIIQHPSFEAGELSTNFIEKHRLTTSIISEKSSVYYSLGALYQVLQKNSSQDSWNQNDAWRMNLLPQQTINFIDHVFNIRREAHKIIIMQPDNHEDVAITLWHCTADSITAEINNTHYHVRIFKHVDPSGQITQLHLLTTDGIFTLTHQVPELAYEHSDAHQGQLTAPMPGLVVALHVEKGQTVKTGQRLIVMEAMKMEHTICAPRDGIIEEVYFRVGSQVSDGDELLTIS